MRANFPYLIPDRDRYGVMRYYVRRHGRKIRIREKHGTEGFHLAYAEAMLALDPTAAEQREVLKHASAGTLGWLAARYFASAEFRRRRELTTEEAIAWGTASVRAKIAFAVGAFADGYFSRRRWAFASF